MFEALRIASKGGIKVLRDLLLAAGNEPTVMNRIFPMDFLLSNLSIT
jgi:hypothetical protein